MATSGASAGFMVAGPVGALIGAGFGSLVGLGSGALQSYESRDSSFKSYVQEAVQGQLDEQADSLTAGSALAASRETDQISFATLFKGEDKAKQYLADLVQMANTTPFLYDDLTAMSKTLATYGYDENSILPVLQTIGDAGAAEVPCAPYQLFGTEALAEAAMEVCGKSNAVLLGNHGLVCCGGDIRSAYSLACNLEYVAELQYRAMSIGKPNVLTEEQMAEVMVKFQSYGQPDSKKSGY